MNKLKERTRKAIVEAARELFLERPINEVTIAEIARTGEIGEATVYRYFSNKQNLVLAVAVDLSQRVTTEYFAEELNFTGYELIQRFYESYLVIYKTHKEYLSFLNDFDYFIALFPEADREKYQMSIDNYKNMFMKGYRKGLMDLTLRKLDDPDVFYYATTEACLALAKKFGSRDKIMDDDNNNDNVKALRLFIDIILKEIKN